MILAESGLSHYLLRLTYVVERGELYVGDVIEMVEVVECSWSQNVVQPIPRRQLRDPRRYVVRHGGRYVVPRRADIDAFAVDCADRASARRARPGVATLSPRPEPLQHACLVEPVAIAAIKSEPFSRKLAGAYRAFFGVHSTILILQCSNEHIFQVCVHGVMEKLAGELAIRHPKLFRPRQPDTHRGLYSESCALLGLAPRVSRLG